MSPDEYERMYRLEDRHWWFAARRTLLSSALERWRGTLPAPTAAGPLRLLDVGCGTGATLAHLSGYGEAYGVDVEPRALAFCRARGLRTNLALASASALPFADGTFQVAVALDVLEHVGDDRAAAREIARVLAPGGLLFASVPAYPSLWSGHDVALMHRRRYTRAAFESLLTGAGLSVEHRTHTVSALLPPVYLLRHFQRLARLGGSRPARADIYPTPPPLNALLRAELEWEGRVALRTPLPFGVSLFAVARKKRDDAPGGSG